MAQLSHSYMVTGKTIALTIRTFVYLDKSALSEYGFLLTSVWKLLMVFFWGETCAFLCPQGQSVVRTSVAKTAPLSGPPRSGQAACPEQPCSARVSLLQGCGGPLGTPAPPLSWPTVLRVSFILGCVNELSPCCFSKLKSEICCI